MSDSIIGIMITFYVINLLIPLLYKSKNTIKSGDNKIELSYGSSLKIIMLIGIVLCSSFAILLLVKIGNPKVLASFVLKALIIIIPMILAVLCSYYYLEAKNKKIVYENKLLYLCDAFKKQQTFYIKDVVKIVENPLKNMILYFGDGRKLKIDIQMSNYRVLKELLQSNNIIFYDNNNNVKEKGW